MNARPTLAGARWGVRPPDQRFDDIEGLKQAISSRRGRARTLSFSPDRVRALPGREGIVLDLDGEVMVPTAYAASQLSRAVGLPAAAVQVLSPELGAAALNERIERTGDKPGGFPRGATLLLEDQPDGPARLRGLQSGSYGRTWDIDVVEALVEPLMEAGFVPAAASVGAPDQNLALFSSDRDLFCFLVHADPDAWLPTPHGRPLKRGIVIRNSEVGGISLQLRAFWFDSFCTNHMVFGGALAVELSEAHRAGQQSPLDRLLDRWSQVGGLDCLAGSTAAEQGVMARASRLIVAERGDSLRQMEVAAADAVALLAGRARVRTYLPRKLLRAGARRARVYAAARSPEATRTLDERDACDFPGPGISLWHMACGITEVSQEQSLHTDQRAQVDVAIGRVLAVA